MDEKNLNDLILNELRKKDTLSGGHCGTYPVQLKLILNIDYSLIKKSLNQLYEKDMIRVRRGINGLILFCKN